MIPEEAGAGMFNAVFENQQQTEKSVSCEERQLLFEKEVPVPQLHDIVSCFIETPFCGIEKRARIKSNLLAVLATLLLMASIALLAFKNNHLQSEGQCVLITDKGTGSNLLLPDGTKVWLGANSRLSYSQKSGNTFREVALEGVAFFDVASGNTCSFIVHTRTFDVEGRGAAFNLSTYKNEFAGYALLKRGWAAIHLKDSSMRKIILLPDTKVFIP